MISACDRRPSPAGDRGFEDSGACISVISGYVTASRQPRKPSIGFISCRSPRGRRVSSIGSHGLRHFRDLLSVCGRNSCSGGSSRRIVTGRTVHDLEQPRKSFRCIGKKLGERYSACLLVLRQNHGTHRVDAFAFKEHVLGAAEADALSAELAARASAGVSAFVRTFIVRTCRPSPSAVAKSPESSGSRVATCRHDFAGRAVDRECIACA